MINLMGIQKFITQFVHNATLSIRHPGHPDTAQQTNHPNPKHRHKLGEAIESE
jgi:hypothetical protein